MTQIIPYLPKYKKPNGRDSWPLCKREGCKVHTRRESGLCGKHDATYIKHSLLVAQVKASRERTCKLCNTPITPYATHCKKHFAEALKQRHLIVSRAAELRELIEAHTRIRFATPQDAEHLKKLKLELRGLLLEEIKMLEE